MNMITKAMVSLARGFLAYVDEKQNTEIDTTRPDIHMPDPVATHVNAWEDRNVRDLPGEQWKKINIETREAMISNMGRLKVIHAKNPSFGYEIIRPTHSTKSSQFNVCKLSNQGRISLFVPRVVLLTFKGEPEWASRYPSVIKRSSTAFIYKNGNFRDCRVDNLDWIDEKRAMALQRAMDSIDATRNAKKQELELVDTVSVPVPSVTPPAPVSDEAPVQWYDVYLFAGFYQINQNGEVRSLTRYIHRYGARRPEDHGMSMYLTEGEINPVLRKAYRRVRGVTLKPLRLNGEKMVQLCREGTSIQVQIARLLIETFYPHVDKSYRYEYIDGNKDNCVLSNLRVIA